MPEFLNITGKCRGCGHTFRMTREAIESVRPEYGDETTSDEELALAIDFCTQCVSAVPLEGEIVEHEPLPSVVGGGVHLLTQEHIEALRSCVDVADPGDDDDSEVAAEVNRAREALAILGGR
jgi:hypothetical protein